MDLTIRYIYRMSDTAGVSQCDTAEQITHLEVSVFFAMAYYLISFFTFTLLLFSPPFTIHTFLTVSSFNFSLYSINRKG